jgi:glycosyltransferase involved in cell wall biosynthesis
MGPSSMLSDSDSPGSAAPKVSILMTTYNHERFVAEAIEGVLMQQTSLPFELVIGEDCSTDRTREIVTEYWRRYPNHIRLVLPESNLGANAMFLEVLRAARGEYFAMLDGDDYWTSPEKLQRQTEFLDSHPGCALCFHDVRILEEGTDRGLASSLPNLPPGTFDLHDLLLGNFLPCVSVMCRRFEVGELEIWFSDFKAIDWLSWIVLARKGLIGYSKQRMAAYRVHTGGLWSRGVWEDQLVEDLAVYEKLETMLGSEYRNTLSSGALTRRVALAVERCGVPYDRPVLILGDIPVEWWNLNGRTLRTASGSATNCLEAVERLRRTGWTPRPRKPEMKFSSKTHLCRAAHLIVSAHSSGQIDGWKAMESLLQDYAVVWQDEYCTIYEIPVREPGPEWEVVEVRQIRPLNEHLMGGHLDSPLRGDRSEDGGVEILGWTLGRDSKAAAIQFWVGKHQVVTTSPRISRVDVGEAFPDIDKASESGFQAWIDLSDLSNKVQIKVVVELEGGETHPLGEVELKKAGRSGKNRLPKFWLWSPFRPLF